MLDTFPGLRSLRAFDASARHLSFSRAAEELHVTPAAISHQIKELEDQTGCELFIRTSRTMRLTKAGEILFESSRESLDILGRALSRMRRLTSNNQLRVSSAPSIAAKWLVPRLERFFAIFPSADVRVDIAATPVDFARDDADVAIRFGLGKYPGLRADLLFADKVFPVCNPRIITKDKPLKVPRDLLKHTLIHLDWEAQGSPWPNWRMWMLAAGVKEFNSTAGLHFDHTALAVQAALDGFGVALGDSNLVADDLAAGRLIKPFELSLNAPADFAYFIISPIETAEQPMIKAFREWCLTEARATELSASGSYTAT
jgi:LysR family transcriptional regulator, glycine cleavage system transcriptional activator